MPNRILLYAFTLLASACTTAMYNGPKKPPSELAIIAADGAIVSAIDGVETPYSGGSYGQFQVLPGEHSVGVAVNKAVENGRLRSHVNRRFTLCMKAEAGKTYRVKTEMWLFQLRLYIIDESSEALVSHPCWENTSPTSSPAEEHAPPHE